MSSATERTQMVPEMGLCRCGARLEPLETMVMGRVIRIPRTVCSSCHEEDQAAEVVAIESERDSKLETLRQAQLGRVPPRFAQEISLDGRIEVWVRRLLEGSDMGLYLVGPVGSGKTHQAWQAWRRIAREKPEMKMEAHRVASLFDLLRPDGDRTAIKRCQTADLLILDDLGGEKASEFTRERLYEIIDERYIRCLPVLLTANLPPQRIEAQVGMRVASRLAQMCDVVPLTTADRRKVRSA